MLNEADKGFIEDFKAKARAFWDLFTDLKSQEKDVARYPQLKPEYDELIIRGDNIRDKVETITSKVDSITGWFKSTFGLDGLTKDQLGLLPLIPVAIIGAALTAIGYWTTDVIKFQQKLNEAKRLESKGLTPQQAANIIAQQGGGFFGAARPLIFPMLIGGGIFLWLKSKGKI